MNKYQEAITFFINLHEGRYKDRLKYLKELVEKSIPKKQIDNRCPNCNSINIFYRKKEDSDWLVHNKYCPDCGQANEWIIDDTNR
jgi:phage FluMu protein Com